MKKLSVGFAALSLAFLVGCSKGPASDNSAKIIKVNDDVITQKMFDKAFDSAYKTSFLAGRNINLKDPKNKFIYLIYKDKAVNELIVKELILEEAKKRKIEVTNSEIDKAFDETAKKVGSKEKLENMLTMNNINKDDFLENIKMDILTKKLVENVSPKVNISDAEASEFYNKNKTTKFTFPDMVRAKHILISASPNEIKAKIKAENPNMAQEEIDKKVAEEMNADKAKAEKIMEQIKKNPSDFDSLAKKYSDDPGSAQKGGDLGFFSKKDMVPAFSKAAFSTLPGQISDLVQTNFGYHIILVVDRKKAGSTPFAEVKNEIKAFLGDQKKIVTLQKVLDSSKNTAKIVYLDNQYNPNNIQKEIKDLVKSAKSKSPTIVQGNK